jgi:hypothetical protein
MSHRVKTHRWRDGTLETIDHFFEELEEAMTFAENSDAHTVKVYDDSNDLIHVTTESGVPEQISLRYSYSGYEESYSGFSSYA